MQAYTDGQAIAFERLYARHEASLFRFVRRLLGADLQAQADEVFQDCWLRIVSARQSYRPHLGASWKTWAFTIAHNLTMDRLRKSGREVSAEDHYQSRDESDPHQAMENLHAVLGQHDASAEDVAHWRAAGAQLLRCLDHLPQVQRSAFLMHYEQDLSLEDIAQALAVGFETVKSRLRYALGKLRGCMQAYITWELR
jgi:RNA polymerase sigma factor (sigma-70 family)